MPSNFVIDENSPCRGGSSVAVLIVGYQDDYFIVKGSWGTDLGDNGYFRIKMSQGGAGICGIMSRSFFPIVQNLLPN